MTVRPLGENTLVIFPNNKISIISLWETGQERCTRHDIGISRWALRMRRRRMYGQRQRGEKKPKKRYIHHPPCRWAARPMAESGENYHHNFPRSDGRRGCKGGEQKEKTKEKKSNLKISLTSPVSLFILHEFLWASGRPIPQHSLFLSLIRPSYRRVFFFF